MHPFPLLVAALVAVLAAVVAEAESWLGDGLVLVLMACLGTALVGFSWWELWASRHER
jgi:hypothetical protein